MSSEQINVITLDTYLSRDQPLIRIDAGAYPLDWYQFVRRMQYATMAEQHEGMGVRWLAEMIPVSLADDVWTVITHRRLRRLYSQGEPCGVIERIEISMADDERVIVAAVPAGPGTTDQEIRIYASRPGAISRARALIDSLS